MQSPERTIRKDSIEEEDIGHDAGNVVKGTMEWKPPQKDGLSGSNPPKYPRVHVMRHCAFGLNAAFGECGTNCGKCH